MTAESKRTLLGWSPEKLVTLIESKDRTARALEEELRKINQILEEKKGVIIGMQDVFMTHEGVSAALDMI
jgi:hypothetical protein